VPMRDLPPIRSWLYAPGNNAKLLDRVFRTEADAVVLDLEDAVPASEKARAREMVAETVRARPGEPGPLVFVRINHPDSGLAEDDVAAVIGPRLDGLRIPKVEAPETVRRVTEWVMRAEAKANLPANDLPLVCNIETALGIWNALEIAGAGSRVLGLGFGAVDFVRDVGGVPGPDGIETLYARSRLVLASRVAGVRPPVDSVYARLDDDAGLERSTRRSRELGFFGRSAIHPRQLAIINTVFTPSADEVERARAIVEAAATAEATGSGALQLPGGDFVDLPVVRRAESLLWLAERLAASRGGEQVR
jgi:citrate lyase subunit beta / citryl-CoA lyase